MASGARKTGIAAGSVALTDGHGRGPMHLTRATARSLASDSQARQAYPVVSSPNADLAR